MMNDLASFYDATQRALKRLILEDIERSQEFQEELFFAHRFAHYLENELRQTLLHTKARVDLRIAKKTGNIFPPNIEICNFGEGEKLAIYFKLQNMGVNSKKSLIELNNSVNDFHELIGISLKPQRNYLLWYFVYEGAVHYRKISKKKLISMN